MIPATTAQDGNDGFGLPSITLDEYHALPDDVRHEVDDWMRAEGLISEMIVSFRLLEGAIEAERYAQDPNGEFVIDAGLRVTTERRVYPIKAAPPREAMSR